MPSFRNRLRTKDQKRQYDRSEQVHSIRLSVTPRMVRAVELLEGSLQAADRARTQKICQVLCDDLCTALEVPRVRVAVNGRRREHGAKNSRYELHGLYESDGETKRIQVWMITKVRGEVVKFKTFLRTLLHEVCHHLDFHLLDLGESFHTDGFRKRESSLMHQLLADASVAAVITRTFGSPERRPRSS